jgi:hypothetical protein
VFIKSSFSYKRWVQQRRLEPRHRGVLPRVAAGEAWVSSLSLSRFVIMIYCSTIAGRRISASEILFFVTESILSPF